MRSSMRRDARDSRLVFVAAQEEDLRAMERMSRVKAERFPDWSEATGGRDREAALLADFDAGFVVPGRKPLVVVTASDVLGSRAHHPQPMARAWNAAFDHTDVPELGSSGRSSAARTGLARWIADRWQPGDVSSREMIRLVFAGDDAVLVPPADLALIWPYASEPGELTLDKADGSTWWVSTYGGRARNSNRRQAALQAHQPATPPAGSETCTSGAHL